MSRESPYRAAGTFAGPAYVEREADHLLQEAIHRNRRYAYIAAPRQSGKSSLLTRTRHALATADYVSAFVDLSTFDVSDYDNFWQSFLDEIAVSANLDTAPINPTRPENTFRVWIDHPPVRLVVFIDEIDTLIGAKFCDQFFSKIRSLFNKRAQELRFERLIIVLAGAAHPTQLIKDHMRSPFNVGIEIKLDDLTLERTRELVSYLEGSGANIDDAVTEHLHAVTGGSVFLCQLLLERLWTTGRDRGVIASADVATAVGAIVENAGSEMHFQNIYQLVSTNARLRTALGKLHAGQSIDENSGQDLRIAGISDGVTAFRNEVYRRVFGEGGPLDLLRRVDLLRLGGPVAEWLQWGARQYGFVRVVGFQDKYKIVLPLQDVFVQLSVHPRERGEPIGNAWTSDRAKLYADRPRNTRLDEALALASSQPGMAGIVLLGDPGTGKTTLLYHLYSRVATDGSASMGLPDGLCPVYIQCSSITSEDLRPFGLRAVILREAERRGYPDAGRRVIDEGRPMLFLLDGLDAVRDKATRVRVCEWLGRETAHWPGSCFVVTCRFTAFRDEARLDNQFLRVEVESLTEGQVRDFVHRWFRAIEAGLSAAGEEESAVDRAAERAEVLLKVVLDPERQRNLRTREMTENPLLLSTLCLVHHSDLRVPDKHGELYDRCLSLLLETWAAHAKRPGLPDKPARLVLQRLAYEMHTRAMWELSCAEAEAVVAAPLAEIPALPYSPSEFLEIACEQCGVLASRNLGSYGFFHLSFQEYLTAAHVKEKGLATELARRAGDPWWHEVVLLAMSMPGMFQPFLRELIRADRLAENVELLRACLDETIQVDEAPFVELLDSALAQWTKPRSGLPAWLGRKPEPNLSPAVCAVLELMRGRNVPGVIERAHKLADHPDAAVAAAARTFLGRPIVEQVTEHLPTGATWGEPVTGMSFVWVPPGRFLMGSSMAPGTPGFDPEAWDDETPAHEVKLPHGVWMAENPVTNAQYGAFLVGAMHAEPPFWYNRRFNAPDQPVVGVTFEDALAFCAWLTERVPLQDGYGFDLPTEAEWEHAARGSDARKYPWGNDDPTPERACFGQLPGSGTPAPLHGRPAGKSSFGCQDMAGNVWEWCLDAWREQYDNAITSVDPCHSGNRGAPRTVRGGAWNAEPCDLRCAVRRGSRCGIQSPYLGFRVVCRSSRKPWLIGS